MSHQAFLIALSQMASHQKARIIVDGHQILIEEAQGGWNFTTEVFSVDGFLPPSIGACVSPSGRIHVQHQGPYLKFDAEHQVIVLTSLARLEKGKYLPFRDHLKIFVEAATEWKTTLLELAEGDCLALRRRKRIQFAVLFGSLLTWLRSAAEIVYESIL